MSEFLSYVPDAEHGIPAVQDLLGMPRGEQLDALLRLQARLAPPASIEAWNTSFGPGSLFDAWTRAPITRALYRANAALLADTLADQRDWRAIEVGGGDGRLWKDLLDDDAQGTLWVVDPHEEPHQQVRSVVPPGVSVRSLQCFVQDADLPEADLLVCSLTLHHVAGQDASQRQDVGLDGPGKLEVLRAFRDALAPRNGLLILNEADVHCDIDLAPGDPILADRLFDSYVRRCAASLLHAIAHEDATDELRARWWTILRRWCLDQLNAVGVSIDRRDVYELDVPRWMSLLDDAGFHVVDRGFTDRWSLFHRYVCRPR